MFEYVEQFCSFSDVKSNKRQKMNVVKLGRVLKEFPKIRKAIYKLRYDAERIDASSTDTNIQSMLDELALVYPCIVAMSDAADFITRDDYKDSYEKLGVV